MDKPTNDPLLPESPVIDYSNDGPILAELRRQREEYLESIGYDMDRYDEEIRRSQARHGDKLVSFDHKNSAVTAKYSR